MTDNKKLIDDAEQGNRAIEEREALRRAVQSVTWNASNYPRKAQPHILGADISPITDSITDAVLAAGFGFRRSAQVRAILTEAHRVWFGIERGTHTLSDLDQVLDPSRWSVKDREGETHD
ncbi:MULTISPECIES: hypothetical protein [unclassified Microbacterium]|uniref:hypothetical protein n=1 Tax=unclassified Microbacterium TaxID=2609290 RepID=UPI0010F5978C|nr:MULTISPECIES: hypothetical protein [unclassified Microbacterium]